MKKFVIAVAVAATAAMAVAAPHGSRHGDGAPRMEKFAEKLGLSEAQKEQIKAIHQADADKNRQLYSDVQSKRQEYRQLRRANDPRAETIKSELGTLKDQVKAAREATHQQILNVLTAEQRLQLEQWNTERGPRRRK